jgi:hypothetical protein
MPNADENSFPWVIKNQWNQEAHKNHMDARKPVNVLPAGREHEAKQPCQMYKYNEWIWGFQIANYFVTDYRIQL